MGYANTDEHIKFGLTFIFILVCVMVNGDILKKPSSYILIFGFIALWHILGFCDDIARWYRQQRSRNG